MEKLYHCQNADAISIIGKPENRFIWAEDEVCALHKLKKDIDASPIEWCIDNFEPSEVRDEENKPIIKGDNHNE